MRVPWSVQITSVATADGKPAVEDPLIENIVVVLGTLALAGGPTPNEPRQMVDTVWSGIQALVPLGGASSKSNFANVVILGAGLF